MDPLKLPNLYVTPSGAPPFIRGTCPITLRLIGVHFTEYTTAQPQSNYSVEKQWGNEKKHFIIGVWFQWGDENRNRNDVQCEEIKQASQRQWRPSFLRCLTHPGRTDYVYRLCVCPSGPFS